jgi:alanyl-tRNA synthetase
MSTVISFLSFTTPTLSVDLTELMCREKGYSIDMKTFNPSLEAQKERAERCCCGKKTGQN